MAANGTSFEINVPVKAAEAAKAADDLANLETRLKAAGAASSAAADAVKAGEASYKSAMSAFDNATKAVERIGIMADAQKGKLEAAMKAGDEKAFFRAAQAIQDLNLRQDEARTKADAAKASLDSATVSLDGLRSAAAAAAESQAQVGASLEDAATKAASAARAVTNAEKNQAAAFEATRKALLASQREIGEAVAARVDASIKAEEEGASKAEEAADKAKKSAADAAGTGKANEAAEAFGKIGGPIGALGQKVFGLKAGWDKMKATFGDAAPLVAGAAAAAVVVVAVIALGVAAVAALAKFGAWTIGLADNARTQGMLSAGIAQSVAGGDILQSKIESLGNTLPLTSDELRSMASNLAATGLRGQDLANGLQDAATKAAKLKYGPDFGKQMFSLEQMSKRLHMGVTGIFGGLKIDGFLEKMSSLVDLFEANSATANAIKVVFESFFQPAIDGAEDFIPKIVATFIALEIWALQGLIAIKPYGWVFRDMGSAAEVMGTQISTTFTMLSFLAGGAAMALSFMLSIVKATGQGIAFTGTAVSNLGATIAAIDLGEVGRNMMAGLAKGITDGIVNVKAAMKDAATSAVDSAVSFLKIGSPSRLLAEEVGVHIPGGIAMGIDDASGDIEAAAQSAVETTTSVSPSTATSGASSSSSSGGNFAGATFNFFGVSGAEDALTRFRELLTMSNEALLAAIGEAVPNGG